jgi:predicted  nucleic acid-binding Zn-ribbon protein
VNQDPEGGHDELRAARAERDEALQRAADLQTRWEATDVQLRHLRLAFDNAARERDDVMLRLLLLEQELAGLPRPGATVPRTELVEAQRRADELRDRLRHRRGTAKRVRGRNRALRELALRTRGEAEEARAALQAGASLPRRLVRRLRARRARRASRA